MKYVAQAAKALYAFVTAVLASLVTVMVGDVGFADITDGQWVAAVLSGLVVAGGVYGITNATK